MNAKELKELGITDEDLISKIIISHGKGIEKYKSDVEALTTSKAALEAQLAEAGATIESFKAMKPDELKAAADDWKAKAEAAQTEAAAQVAALKFDHALEGALTGAKAKNAKAVKALLDMNTLKFNDADGSVVGLEEQLKKVKEGNDYLFESETQTPKIVTGGQNKSIISDSVVAAARKAAGLPDPK